MVLSDGRLPTGSHTQSAGLEPAFLHGMGLAEVPAYIQARLRTVTEVEAATAVVARQVWLTSPRGDRSFRLAEVDHGWRARTPSDAVRDAADSLARGYRRLVESLWVLDLPDVPLCRAVVVGATAAAAGLDASETARLIGYDDVQTIVAAALKLEPFDPAVGVGWSVAAGVDVERMVGRVEGITTTSGIPAHSAPLIEEWVQAHRTAERRLYRA